MILHIIFFLFIGIFYTSSSFAFSYSVTIEFNEPSEDVAGNPISTYVNTTLKVWYVKDTGESIPQSDIVVPGSGPSGGNFISHPVTFQAIDDFKWIRLYAIANDTSGTMSSKRSNVAIHKIDRTPPSAPR